jgi:4-amino-4-deoxy-L-arabinose transferase-like glycosyltransferase
MPNRASSQSPAVTLYKSSPQQSNGMAPIEGVESVKHFNRLIIAIIALSIFSLVARAFCVDVFTRAESFYAEPAREMLEAHKYLTVLFYNFTVFDKPILNYWCVIAAFKVLGVSIFASRIPSILSGICALCLVALLSQKLYGDRVALLATAALGSSTLFLEMSASCMTDMLLTLLEFCTICLFFFASQTTGRQRKLLCIGFGLVLGLGFLQKGLPAVVLPGLSIVAYSIVVRNQVKVSDVFIGALAFAVTIAPWHLAVYKQQGAWPFYYLYIHEAVDRFCGKSQQYDFGHPPFYMLMALLSGLVPWSIFLPFAVVGLKADWSQRRSTLPQQFLFLMATVLCVHLIFFTISRSNWGYYNLPAFPGTCILIAVYTCRYLPILASKSKLPLTYLSTVMFAGAILAAAYAAIFTWPAKAAIDPANSFSKALATVPVNTQFVSHKNLAGQYFYSDLLLFRTGKVPKYADDAEIATGLSADKPFCAVVTQGYFNALPPDLKHNVTMLRHGQMKYLNFPGCKLSLETPPDKQVELCLLCNKSAFLR